MARSLALLQSSNIVYDCADGRLLNVLTDARAEQYVDDGKARAVRSRGGRIMRLYGIPSARAYRTLGDGVAAMHAAANQTTTWVRLDSGKSIREHKRARRTGGAFFLRTNQQGSACYGRGQQQ